MNRLYHGAEPNRNGDLFKSHCSGERRALLGQKLQQIEPRDARRSNTRATFAEISFLLATGYRFFEPF
jgi:hypothetical protein